MSTKRTKEDIAEKLQLVADITSAAGGTRQLALLVFYPGVDIAARDVPKTKVATVRQWGKRGIPAREYLANQKLFLDLEKKAKRIQEAKS